MTAVDSTTPPPTAPTSNPFCVPVLCLLHQAGLGIALLSVSILVFDMMGRQIENRVVNSNDFKNITLGQNYECGVYNVVVSQGRNSKTVRLVKE